MTFLLVYLKANAEASRHMGKGRRRGNLNPKGSKKPFVEYTRCLEEPVPKKPSLSSESVLTLSPETVSLLVNAFSMYDCMYVFVPVSVRVCMLVCVCVHICMHVCGYMCACMYVCLLMCVFVPVSM